MYGFYIVFVIVVVIVVVVVVVIVVHFISKGYAYNECTSLIKQLI